MGNFIQKKWINWDEQTNKNDFSAAVNRQKFIKRAVPNLKTNTSYKLKAVRQSDVCSEKTERITDGRCDSPVKSPCSVHSAARRSGSAAPALCSAISVRSQPQQHSSLSWTPLWDDPRTLPWRHAAEQGVRQS